MGADPLRVIHVFPYSPSSSGGHANAIWALMRAQAASGIDVIGIGPRDEAIASVEVAGIPISEFPAGEVPAEVLARARHRITHLHAGNAEASRVAAVLRKANRPYVITSHGQFNFRSPLHFAKKFLYLNGATRLARGAAGIHFLTARERRRFRWMLPGWGGATLVHPHVIELPSDGDAGPRSEFEIPKDAFVFGTLGRIDVGTKGLDLLLESFARLSSQAWLIFVGPDWEGGEALLRQSAKALGCDGRVIFAGPRYGTKKWEALRMMDAFVAPSRWDAFNLALAEAMACGVPAIVSNKMNLSEALGAGGCASVCSNVPGALAAAMARLMNGEETRRSLGQAGRQWVQSRCSSEAAGRAFTKFYKEISDGV